MTNKTTGSIVLAFVVTISTMCSTERKVDLIEEIATAKAPAADKCFTVCDPEKYPDLKLVTNVTDQPQVDGVIDTNTYFWQTYHVRTHPVRLTQNYLTPASYTHRYGWDSGVVVNRVQLQCLVENIAPFSCSNDWVFNESQGYYSPLQSYFFDGLFEFETFEQVGNRWKRLYKDYKKEFNPSVVPTQEYVYSTFCYYNERSVQAQTGDFYYNYFRFPNHDGVYKLVVKFNPVIKGCRAVKETNYTNNEETVILEIINGTIKIHI